MENKQLPAKTQERIKADAVKTASDLNMKGRNAYEIGWEAGYIAGATAEAQWKVKYDELADYSKSLRDDNNKLRNEVVKLEDENESLKGKIKDIASHHTFDEMDMKNKGFDGVLEICERYDAIIDFARELIKIKQ